MNIDCIWNISLCVEADYNPSTNITVTPPSTMACIDFTDLVVDDTIALEGLQNFTICVGGSSAWVVIVDDDSEGSLVLLPVV